jgi:hypothetical protein
MKNLFQEYDEWSSLEFPMIRMEYPEIIPTSKLSFTLEYFDPDSCFEAKNISWVCPSSKAGSGIMTAILRLTMPFNPRAIDGRDALMSCICEGEDIYAHALKGLRPQRYEVTFWGEAEWAAEAKVNFSYDSALRMKRP